MSDKKEKLSQPEIVAFFGRLLIEQPDFSQVALNGLKQAGSTKEVFEALVKAMEEADDLHWLDRRPIVLMFSVLAVKNSDQTKEFLPRLEKVREKESCDDLSILIAGLKGEL